MGWGGGLLVPVAALTMVALVAVACGGGGGSTDIAAIGSGPARAAAEDEGVVIGAVPVDRSATTAEGIGGAGAATSAAEPATTVAAAPTTTGSTAPAAAVIVRTEEAIFGPVLSDGEGRTLYGYTADTAGSPTCVGSCSGLWPPVLVAAGLEAGDAVDPAILSIAPRSGGDPQLVVAGQPAYYFVEDQRPGSVSGHGTDGAWFVFRTDGTLMRPAA